MKKIILIILTLFILPSCMTNNKSSIIYDDSNLHGYVEIKNINIIQSEDNIHFDIEVDAEQDFNAVVHGGGDSVIVQRFSLDNGYGICSFDIQNNSWPDDIRLFFNVYESEDNIFILTIKKDNLKALNQFTYVSDYPKKQKFIKFLDDNLNSYAFVKDITIKDLGDSYSFHLEVEGRNNMPVFVFDNPNGDIVKKEFGMLGSNNGLIEFDIKKTDLIKMSALNILIGDDMDNIILLVESDAIEEVEHLTFGSNELNITNMAVVDTSNYSGNFNLNKLTYEKLEDGYLFKISTSSDPDMKVMAFNSPYANVYKNTIGKTTGNDTFEFKIPNEKLKGLDEICVMYSTDGSGDASVNFFLEDIYDFEYFEISK